MTIPRTFASCRSVSGPRIWDWKPDGLVYSSGTFTVENGYRLAEQLVADHREAGSMPDGLIVAADVLAVGALQALNALRVEVPDEFGRGECEQPVHRPVHVAAAEFDAIDQRELARMAFSTLIDGLKHERRVRRHILLTTELVPRASFVPQRYTLSRRRAAPASILLEGVYSTWAWRTMCWAVQSVGSRW